MKPSFTDLPDDRKHVLDATALIALLGSFVSVLPAVASVLTIVWTVTMIYETATMQRLITRERETP